MEDFYPRQLLVKACLEVCAGNLTLSNLLIATPPLFLMWTSETVARRRRWARSTPLLAVPSSGRRAAGIGADLETGIIFVQI